jgi:hypothetical protein
MLQTINNKTNVHLPSAMEASRCQCGYGVSFAGYTSIYTEARYWQANHARAISRERNLHEEIKTLKQSHKEELAKLNKKHAEEISELKALIKKKR